MIPKVLQKILKYSLQIEQIRDGSLGRVVMLLVAVVGREKVSQVM